MDQNFSRTDLLPVTVPSAALWILLAVSAAAWLCIHFIVRSKGGNLKPHVRIAICVPIGTACSWLLFQTMARYISLTGHWHLFLMALLTAVSFEFVSWLYSHEGSRLHSRRSAFALLALRLAAIGVTIFMLLQPVLVGEKSRTIRRRVVILSDESASMQFRDKYWKDEERLDVAMALGVVETDSNPIAGIADELAKADSYLESAAGELSSESALPPAAEGEAPLTERLKVFCSETSESVKKRAEDISAMLSKVDRSKRPDTYDMLQRVRNHLQSAVLPSISRISDEISRGADSAALSRSVSACSEVVRLIVPMLPDVERAGGVVLYDGMDEASREKVAEAADVSRHEITRRLLDASDGESTISRIMGKYDVDLFRFGSVAEHDNSMISGASDKEAPAADEAAAGDSDSETAFRSSTDMTKALETVVNEIPGEEIAGVLMFSDGLHNGDAGVDAVVRKLSTGGVPVSTVLIGGTKDPLDVTISDARCPESVFLGDKVRFNVSVSATGARQKTTNVRLFLDDKEIESKELQITSDDWTSEVRFSHLPEERGLHRYRVAVDVMDGEDFKDNNSWNLDVSVSDDRTNVLLVDYRPRWEFRYLRNLFYGRDKSVHLQEYLIRPDVVKTAEPPPPLPPASAGRKFGDSESGAFPVSVDEWRKFDVIIIGDVGDEYLTDEVVDAIRYCVSERGALLVLISGPRFMPHGIMNSKFKELVPVNCEYRPGGFWNPPEEAFTFSLTASGRGHPVMSQSSSSAENEDIWQDLPSFHWRFPVDGVKPGSEVLAFAKEVNSDNITLARELVSEMEQDPDAAVRRFSELRGEQERNSLVVARGFGHGKVVMFNTDQMWRLRYKIGDTRHHRFWGQVLRWGAGERLRAGNTFVRMGTDQIRYSPNEQVKVFARIVDSDFNSVGGLSPEVVMLDSEGRAVEAVGLSFREDSNGFYEGVFDPMPDAGVYDLVLRCPKAARLLGGNYPQELAMKIIVVTAKRPAEFVNVAADREIPLKMATISGGKVMSPAEFASMEPDFGEGNKIMHDRTELYLWSSPLLFIIVIVLLACEWILRKREGLA